MRTRLLAAIAATAVATLLNTGVCTAAETTDRAVPGPQAFAGQAKAAKLTNGQAAALRSKVDAYLKKTGGKQIALNEIDLNGQGRVLVTLPGEERPRDFTSSTGTLAAADPCITDWYTGYFCAYKSENFKGDRIDMYYCQKYSIPWISQGSWRNNQTLNTSPQARFYNGSGSVIYTTPKPYSSHASYSWVGVYSVKPC
ncbi:peptidase inhibitor family I36 protein [Streptomyces sp. NPDC004227]